MRRTAGRGSLHNFSERAGKEEEEEDGEEEGAEEQEQLVVIVLPARLCVAPNSRHCLALARSLARLHRNPVGSPVSACLRVRASAIVEERRQKDDHQAIYRAENLD